MIESLYDELGGEAISQMVAAFYRQVPADDILGPMYPQDEMEEAEARLRGFLIFRFGGPDDYIQSRGHPRLRMRHARFHVNQAARDRWMELMGKAIDETITDPSHCQALKGFLGDVATAMINSHE